MVDLVIVKEHRLDKNKLKEVRSFVENNNSTSGFPEFFYWDAIEHRIERKAPLDWLCYMDGKLIAYVAIYYFENNVLDINFSLATEMYTHIEEILSQLYDNLYQSFGRYRLYASVFKVNFENKVLTNTLADLGATVVGLSKYLQRDVDAPSFEPGSLTVKQASEENIEILAEIQADCFAINKDEYINFLKNTLSNKNREAYLFYLGGDPIGKVHVLHSENQILIEDICIVPSLQDNNYELAMLQGICNITHNKKSLLVELDSDFEKLTKLYKELGFYEVAIIHNYDKELTQSDAPKLQ